MPFNTALTRKLGIAGTSICQYVRQAIGLIHDIPACAELLPRIEREALDAMERTRSMYTPQSKL